MIVYLYIIAGVLFWLAVGIWVSQVFGRVVDEMEHEDDEI